MSAEDALRQLAEVAGDEDLGRLLLRAHRAVNAVLFERLVALGHDAVRPAHASVFLNLDAEGTRMVTLAQRAGVSRQAISQLVRDVQAAGYIAVEPDPDDGRATRVRLTERGVAFCLQVADVARDLDRRWESLLGAEELDRLRGALHTVARSGPAS
jgi:DNA-binding MarR family transcriptional regulator